MNLAHGLERVETRTMERERRGNSTAGYVGHLFANSLTHGIPQTWDDGGQDPHQNFQDYGVGGGGLHGHKKRLVASDPSPHVIFLGLDTGFTESDVCGIVHHPPSKGS